MSGGEHRNLQILIFGGTTEGRRLSHELAAAGAGVTVCVATEYGSEQQGDAENISVRTGPLSEEQKLELLKGKSFCIDATHPYATHVSESVKTACSLAAVPYIRLRREESEYGDGIVLENAEAAAAWLLEREGNVLLTTGSRELPAFSGLDPKRLFPRVLPSRESLEACEALNIPRRNIIAMQGPFTAEMNTAIIRQYRIRYLVTKDGGVPGGFPEKAAAARETGILLLVLRRPEDEGVRYEDVRNLCMTALRS